MERKYQVNVGEVYKYWKVLEIEIMQKLGKNKDRTTYNNALCICTKCNKNTEIISYKRLHDKNGGSMCQECAGQKRKTTKEYVEELKIKTPLAKLKNGEIYINRNTKLIHICSECGKEFNVTPEAVLAGQHRCRECGIKDLSNILSWDTEKYIKELKIKNPFVKLKKGQIYKNNATKIIHICSRCGKDWEVVPAKVLAGQIMCKKCTNKLSESVHATLIKQIYKYEYGYDCIWEEKIKIDENIYEVDIVNHARKEAVEIDGEQHRKINNFHKRQSKKNHTTPEYEFKQQQIRDEKVNNYFKEIGYNLIRIPVDNKISPLQSLQKIFPQYNYIPDWIDFSGKITRHKWDVAKAQELINKGIHFCDIARQLNINQSSLNQAIDYGQIIVPKDYKKLKIRNWDINKAQILIDNGMKINAIAKKLNTTHSAINWALYKGYLIRHDDKNTAS